MPLKGWNSAAARPTCPRKRLACTLESVKKTRICIVLILLLFVEYSMLLLFLSRRSLNKCAHSPLTTKLCCFRTLGTRRGHSSGRRGDRGGLPTWLLWPPARSSDLFLRAICAALQRSDCSSPTRVWGPKLMFVMVSGNWCRASKADSGQGLNSRIIYESSI